MPAAGRSQPRGRVQPASSGAKRDPAPPSMSRARCCAATGSCSGGLLEREAAWLPPWRDLLRVYRRLESRGEIRGGRFVAGFSGEQFALPDAIVTLREIRRKPLSGDWLSVCGADPLNLVGILTPGPKLPALTGNRLLYRDGIAVPCLPAVKSSSSRNSIRQASGRRTKLCCASQPRSGQARRASLAPGSISNSRVDLQ